MKNSPLRVLLVGAAGRMGKTIVDLAKDDPNVEIVAQCDIGDAIESAMKKSDVVIDFSHPDAIDELCRAACPPAPPRGQAARGGADPSWWSACSSGS